MTRLEICAFESANPGRVYLYPEGAFYKAYQHSAWLLCTRVHPFKVSARPLKGLDGPLVSVGFPQSSLDKFAAGLRVADFPSVPGGKVLEGWEEAVDFDGFAQWREAFVVEPKRPVHGELFSSLAVYGAAYRLAVEVTGLAARLPRDYRYSLGEDIRRGVKSALLGIGLAGKDEDRLENIRSARLMMLDVQLSLRLLNDLKVLPDPRYVCFLDLSEGVVRQLSNWERSERQRHAAAGVSSPP